MSVKPEDWPRVKAVFQYAVALEGAALLDVRLLGWGAPPGGEAFPRAAEVHEGEALRLRFTTTRATPNARLADTLF